MGSHSKDNDMIPRVTVRDATDAELLKLGLVELSKKVQSDYRQQAATGEDQIALTIQMNDRIQVVMGLLRAVGDGTMSEASVTTHTEED